MPLSLTSPAFTNGGDFPTKYTCNGQNTNPPLVISDVPKNAKSLVLILDDPDAAKEPAGNGKTFDHWLLYNIAPASQSISEGTTIKIGESGKNSSGGSNYIGPCPPTFRHEYIFRLLALDSNLQFDKAPTKAELEEATQPHVIETARLTAYYQQPA